MADYLAVDVGGTAIKYALMNENAEISEKGEVPTPHESLDEFVETIGKIYDMFASKNPLALVMSAPGKIDAHTGYFYTGGALLYIHKTDMKGLLAKRVPIPFAVENDAKSAALAELWKGSMKGVTNGFVLALGTGLGGALIIDGKLYRGSTFAAGEVSCVCTDLNKPYNPANSWAVPCGVHQMIGEYAKAVGKKEEELDGRQLFAAGEKGDENAIAAIRHYCSVLACGLISLQHILDVERVAIGGGISKAPLLMKTLKEELDAQYAPYKEYVPASMPEVVSCEFGNDANMIGALYHYVYELKGEC
jgi:predicted NBD/HSP70 family sugar kinase